MKSKKNHVACISMLCAIPFVLALLTQCKPNIESPGVLTQTVEAESQHAIICKGVVTDHGGELLLERGFCWALKDEPTVNDSTINSGKNIGDYSTRIEGLLPGVTYFVRAYARNSVGVAYGKTLQVTTLPTKRDTVSDIDGNVYTTVTIGEQEWFAQNLRATRTSDNQVLQLYTDSLEWTNPTAAGYCAPNDIIENIESKGLLYNGYAVEKHKICPKGWHIPTEDDWNTLFTYLYENGYSSEPICTKVSYYSNSYNIICDDDNKRYIVQSLTKQSEWEEYYLENSPNSNEFQPYSNITGFSAIPCEMRSADGDFYQKYDASWWISDLGTIQIYSTSGNILYSEKYTDKRIGHAVRCVKD